MALSTPVLIHSPRITSDMVGEPVLYVPESPAQAEAAAPLFPPTASVIVDMTVGDGVITDTGPYSLSLPVGGYATYQEQGTWVVDSSDSAGVGGTGTPIPASDFSAGEATFCLCVPKNYDFVSTNNRLATPYLGVPGSYNLGDMVYYANGAAYSSSPAYSVTHDKVYPSNGGPGSGIAWATGTGYRWLVVTWNQATDETKFYLDGVLVTTTTGSGTANENGSYASAVLGINHGEAIWSRFVLYNRILTADEIANSALV